MNRLLPAWLRDYWRLQDYRRQNLPGDIVAGLVVTLLLVPQGLAYAALAGLPPQLGLYASLSPLVVFPLYGSSLLLRVGPVAVAPLMTAAALAPIASAGSPEYIAAAIVLALLSGAMLFFSGVLRLGAVARLLSYPVVSGFISGVALLIMIGQLRPLLGIAVEGETAAALLIGLFTSLGDINTLAAAIGLSTLLILWLVRRQFAALLQKLGLKAELAGWFTKLVPMLLVLGSAALVALAGWQQQVDIVGTLPAGLPSLVMPEISLSLVQQLWWPALMIGLIGFVESVAIAQTFAARQGQRIDANAELRGLGAANIASAFSGAFPISGGFSRTAVNADAGARTPLAGIISALLIALVLLFATGLFRTLPMSVLAATIIIAALSLVDVKTLRDTWHYDRTEGVALLATALGVLLAGIEVGIGIGVALSLARLVWRASRPHMAVLGRVPGTEHFRNVARHEVQTRDDLLMVRVDESLFFGNAESVEKRLHQLVAAKPEARHLVLVLSSVSHIDATALDMLQTLDRRLLQQGIRMHLAEVKGPVMDQLEAHGLSGRVFLSAQQAFEQLLARSD